MSGVMSFLSKMLIHISFLLLLNNGIGMADNCSFTEMENTFLTCFRGNTTGLFTNGTIGDYCRHDTEIKQAIKSCLNIASFCSSDPSDSLMSQAVISTMAALSDVNEILHALFCESAHPCNAVDLQNCLPGVADFYDFQDEMIFVLLQHNITELFRNLCMEKYFSSFTKFFQCWKSPMEKSLPCFVESPQKNHLFILRGLHGFVELVRNSFYTICSQACLVHFGEVFDGIVDCSMQVVFNVGNLQELDFQSQCRLFENFSLCIKEACKECAPLRHYFLEYARSFSIVRGFLDKCTEHYQGDISVFGLRIMTTIPERFLHFSTRENHPKDLFRTASLKPYMKEQFVIHTTWPDRTKTVTGSETHRMKEIPGHPGNLPRNDAVDIKELEQPVSTTSPGKSTTTSSAPEDNGEKALSIVLSAVILTLVMASGI